MPLYLDRHELSGATAVDVAGAHLRDLALGKGFDFEGRGSIRPKGFSESIRVFEVRWGATPAA